VVNGQSAAASPLAQSTLLGELLEGAPVGVLAIDARRCVAANAYACELLGYERGELIGSPVAEPLTHRDGSRLEIEYRVVESAFAGMPVRIGVFWPA
jgi:PAS domain S-box-containing protein